MSRYARNDPETWLPAWARGKGLDIQVVRIHCKDGSVEEFALDANHETGEITDERCERHLDADPRFTKL